MSERVPEGWEKHILCELGKFSTSSVDKKSSSQEEVVKLLNYMDVYQNSRLDESFPFQQVTAPTKQIASSSVQNGDIFFTPSSETPDDIGHSAVFIGNLSNIVHSYHTVRFRMNSDQTLDDEFKAYAFKSENTYKHFRQRAAGSTRFTVSLPAFENLPVLIPSLPEQKKIASILTSVDDVIETTQRQIDKLQDLKKATMNKLLTQGIGHTEFKDSVLGKIPKSWRVVQIRDLAQVKGGKRLPKGRPFSETKTDYPYIRISDFENGTVGIKNIKYVFPTDREKIKRYTISEQDLCVSIAGVHLGLFVEIPKVLDGALLTENAAKLVFMFPQQINRTFIKFICQFTSVQLQILQEKGVGGGVPKLALFRISETYLTLPKKAEQDKISEIISSFESQIFLRNKKLHQTQSLKKSLMQDLLTGKVRVQVN